MKYVVTGGAGFIGSHVAAALLERGHDVVVIDDFSSGKQENLDGVLAGLGSAAPGRMTVMRASILDRDALRSALPGAAAVLHQAAIASVPRSFREPAATLRANVEGTATLLEACREAGVRRFVMASSSSLYGDTPTLPKHEGMTPTPLSPYALSKRIGEDLMAIWARQYGLQAIGLRYFNVFGPRQDPTSEYAAVIPRFITRMLAGERPIIFGDGTQSRDFTFIDNAVAANLLAAGVDGDIAAGDGDAAAAPEAGLRAAGQGVNIGVGERYRLLELVDALNQILGTRLEPELQAPRVGDVKDSLAAIDRARELIGYAPLVGFREGLERTVAWYGEQRRRAEQVRSA